MKNSSKKIVQPKLVLDDRSKIYLAVHKKSVNKLIFVYMLVSNSTVGRYWDVIPTTEIATFDDADEADIYLNTILQVMEYQQKFAGLRAIKNNMEEEIKAFNEKVR